MKIKIRRSTLKKRRLCGFMASRRRKRHARRSARK